MNSLAYTPVELYNLFNVICGLIITSWAVIEILYKVKSIRGRPDEKQNKILKDHTERLAQHDEKFKEYDQFFKRDKERLDDVEVSNKVIQKALLALLSHAINGNDMDSLQKAKDSLEDYLTNK